MPQWLPVNTTLSFLLKKKNPLEVEKKSRINISSDFKKGLLAFYSSYIRNKTWQGVTVLKGRYHYHHHYDDWKLPTNWKFAWKSFSLRLIFTSVYPRTIVQHYCYQCKYTNRLLISNLSWKHLSHSYSFSPHFSLQLYLIQWSILKAVRWCISHTIGLNDAVQSKGCIVLYNETMSMLEQTPTAVNQTSKFLNDLLDTGLMAIDYFK